VKVGSVLVLAILAQAAGNIFLSKALRHPGAEPGIHALLPYVLQIAANPMVWIGTGLLILFFILYSVSLSWADLSFVLPASSFGYILNVALAHHFLQEAVSPMRWFGTILIAVGVLLVSKAGSRSFEGSSL
jgi:drug/metabolite transporter (DMT)-like permease